MANAQLRERTEKLRLMQKNSEIREKRNNNRLPEAKISPTAVADSTISQLWEGSDWVPVQYTKITYSADMKEQSVILRKYAVDEWVPVTRTSTRLDNERQITWLLVELPDGESWKPEEQKYAAYINGLVTEELYQVYRNNEWINSRRYTAQYNEYNKEIEILTEDWNGEWIKSYRNSTEYNANGDVTLEKAEFWNGTQWVGMNKDEYMYDEVNKKTTSEFSIWNENKWVPVDRIAAVSGSNNENIETVYQEWDGSQWVNVTLTEYNYDDNTLNVTDYIMHYWDGNNNTWFDGERSFYTYENNILTETVTQVRDGDEWVNSSRSTVNDGELEYISLFQTWNGTDWVNSGRWAYVYKQITGVNDDVRPLVFNLEQNYPNPFNPVTNIIYTVPQAQHIKLNVYNILGQLVKTLVDEEIPAGKHSIQFNAAGFSSGVYYYRVETGSTTDTRSMLLLK